MSDKKSIVDQDLIRELAKLLTETGLTEIEVEHDDTRIRVARGAAPAAVQVPVAAIVAEKPKTAVAEEAVKRLNEKLGTSIAVQWETPGWDLITAGSWGGRWDVSIGSMSVTETRAKVVDFADPYYFDGGGIAVSKDSTLTSLDQLNGGKTFCVGASTTYEQWLNQTLEIVDPAMIPPPTDPQVTALPTDNECIQAVAAGRKFDAIVANKNGLESAIEKGQPIKLLVDEPTFTVSVSFALDKSGPATGELLEVFNEIVADMHADGTLKALSEKWLGEDVTTRPS